MITNLVPSNKAKSGEEKKTMAKEQEQQQVEKQDPIVESVVEENLS